ncbi:MAG TPA: GNAT family N-acetyltransferase [Polyangiaceae bacterium]|nr:GNAT family N-acetyltransferase [Polyangiaceae bacterium]
MRLEVLVERAGSQHQGPLAALFKETHSGCYCQFWHFSGDKNDWQLRCAEGEGNCAQMRSSLETDSAHMHGFVALSGDRAVGWLKLSAATEIDKLYEQRLYRGLPCFTGDRAGIYTIGCMLVASDVRRQGVARGLLQAAITWAQMNGARAIEAFPRRVDQPHDSDLWLGPLGLFEEFGFQMVHAFEPYPVLRLRLAQ